MKKMLFCITAALFTLFATVQPVKAQENPDLSSDPGVYVFTMDEGHQVQQYYDDSGNIVTITVDSSPSLTRSVASGERTISFTSSLENVSYKIYISGNSIISAYDGHYSVWGYTVSNAVLSIDSSTQASFLLYCSALVSSFIKSLQANISGDSIIVSFHRL